VKNEKGVPGKLQKPLDIGGEGGIRIITML